MMSQKVINKDVKDAQASLIISKYILKQACFLPFILAKVKEVDNPWCCCESLDTGALPQGQLGCKVTETRGGRMWHYPPTTRNVHFPGPSNSTSRNLFYSNIPTNWQSKTQNVHCTIVCTVKL